MSDPVQMLECLVLTKDETQTTLVFCPACVSDMRLLGYTVHVQREVLNRSCDACDAAGPAG